DCPRSLARLDHPVEHSLNVQRRDPYKLHPADLRQNPVLQQPLVAIESSSPHLLVRTKVGLPPLRDQLGKRRARREWVAPVVEDVQCAPKSFLGCSSRRKTRLPTLQPPSG